MNYRGVLIKSRIKRSFGIFISFIAIVSTVISLLRMVYFRLDDGTILGSAIAKSFKQLVLVIYENTRFLEWFWQNCPTPNFIQIQDPENIYFLATYVCIFVGFALYASGKKLAIHLDDINRQIENQLIRESIQGKSARTRQEIENATEIPNSSIFSQFHQLYFAPIITAIIGTVILKLLGF